MAKFNDVHWKSLPDEGQLREDELWQVVLKEPLQRASDFYPDPADTIIAHQIFHIVTFVCHNGKLEPYSRTDEGLFKSWKLRHKHTPDDDFR